VSRSGRYPRLTRSGQMWDASRTNPRRTRRSSS